MSVFGSRFWLTFDDIDNPKVVFKFNNLKIGKTALEPILANVVPAEIFRYVPAGFFDNEVMSYKTYPGNPDTWKTLQNFNPICAKC